MLVCPFGFDIDVTNTLNIKAISMLRNNFYFTIDANHTFYINCHRTSSDSTNLSTIYAKSVKSCLSHFTFTDSFYMTKLSLSAL